MTEFKKEKAHLLLEDGTYMEGTLIGKPGTAGGEICFNTGMTGYQEIYTDPSYYGQVVINTTAHIGNYGVMDQDEEESSTPKVRAIIVNEFSEIYSRYKASKSLQEYLEHHGVTGISGIDTRKLVRHVRNKGAMNCIISSELNTKEALKKALAEIPKMEGLELSSVVATKKAYTIGDEAAGIRIAVLDLGIKSSILTNLVKRGCYCKVFPAKTDFSEMDSWNPDGYFISNGPGDPAVMDYAVTTVKNILDSGKPLFGICLGHQMLARACGITTYKMHHGHRGINHPVKNLITGKGEITSQNHGFTVDEEEVKKSNQLEITHIHLNDQTIAGIKVIDKKAFSVQYHPEASPGPHDSRYLFDDFLALIKAGEKTFAKN